MVVLTAVVALGGRTFLLATALILANRKLHVEEVLRIDVVEEMLDRTFVVLRDDDADGRKYVEAMDDEVDRLHEGIKIYLDHFF